MSEDGEWDVGYEAGYEAGIDAAINKTRIDLRVYFGPLFDSDSAAGIAFDVILDNVRDRA